MRKDSLKRAEGAGGINAWNIAVYIRLSRDDGNDESLSVANQRKILLEYVHQAFHGNGTVADVYVDDGLTGTDYERPDFQRMLHDVETGRVNCILCKNLSRAFRNYSDQGYFLENFFPRFHTRFIALGEPKVDTFTDPEAVNGIEIPINGLMNDRFAYKTSCDIRRTFDAKRRKGEFIGAFAPYGYRKDVRDKNRLVVDPEAAGVVKTIFLWYVYGDIQLEEEASGMRQAPMGGLSKGEIARRLNDLGILGPAAYKRSKGLKYSNPQTEKNDGLWQETSVRRILSNEMYIGTMVQGKQKVISYKVHDRLRVPEEEWYRVPNVHEPIVDRDLFALAQTMQEREMRRAPEEGRNYLFAGLLKCADCRKAMTRRVAKGYVYYNCSTYKRKSRTKCSLHSIRQDVLEDAALMAIRKQIERTGRPEEIAEEISKAAVGENRQGRLETVMKSRLRELEKVEKLITDLYLDWKGGELTHDQFTRLKMKTEGRIQQLRAAIERLRKEEAAAAQRAITGHSPYLESFLQHKNIETLSRGLLVELVDEILIHENGDLTIRFRFEKPRGRQPQ